MRATFASFRRASSQMVARSRSPVNAGQGNRDERRRTFTEAARKVSDGRHGSEAAPLTFSSSMIESFKHLEETAADRDLAEVFLETDAQEHGVPADDILAALRKRREVMRDCVSPGKSGGLS